MTDGASRGASDQAARAVALGIAGARVAIGIGAFAFTRKALRGLGFQQPSGATVALARLAGGRDIALGLHALSAAGDSRRLREATAVGVAVDAGDAAAFTAALAGRDGIDRTAILNAPLGAAAAIAGGWALSRL